MTQFKGGRGKTAPYVTTHVRVPTPVKHIVETVIERYKQRLESGEIQPAIADLEELYLCSKNPLTGKDKNLPDISEVIEIAKKILLLKKSARLSMEKLLTSLYKEDIRIS